ncbi:MAG TPA: argininosuccinate synthase domain-containing protein, partial [Phycisphaerae bacterium]|nr:argininosuccinate synthase domain-containing protein [Phycisphaerae bacterium]
MDVKAIEARIFATPVPKVSKVALAYSGGLDSSLAIELLRRAYKVQDIVAITCDVGQGDEEVAVSKAKAKTLGVKPIMIDLTKEFTEQWLAKAIRANSDYEGYPVSTSMTRQLVAREVALRGKELGCDALMEGSTGKGNDQYRMHNVFKMFAPGCQILVPVRDFDLTRGEERALCEAWGVPVDEQIEGGDDKTMWCRSIASGAIDLNQEIPESIWMWLVPPRKAPDKVREITLTFTEGIPTHLDGKKMPLGRLIPALNEIAGAAGIGRIDMFEDGIM